MNTVLRDCLEDLCRRIDEAQEENNRRQWETFARGQWRENVFISPPRVPAPPAVAWPEVRVNATLDDPEAMLFQQFKGVSDALARGSGNRLNVRCNYGSSILPSLFGVELFIMPDETNTLPTSHPLHSADAVRRLIDAGVPALDTSLGGKVFSLATRFLEIFEKYPILKRNIELYHPDVQGPMDVAEVVWGSEIFYAFVDEPELVQRFLGLITDTYVAYMRRWYALVPPPDEINAHWGWAHRGRLMLREDSLMNLSPGIFVEFIRPHDQRLFDEFGGGAIHFCGRGDHFIEALTELRGLHAVNLSQPHMNDMSKIFARTIDRNIPLLGLIKEAVEQAGRPLNGKVSVL